MRAADAGMRGRERQDRGQRGRVAAKARGCERQARGSQGRPQSKTREFEKQGRALEGCVKSGTRGRKRHDRAPLRIRDRSRRTQRQVATIRIWAIADCGEVTFRRGSRPMFRGAQCEADPGVNNTSQVTAKRGHTAQLNMQVDAIECVETKWREVQTLRYDQ